MYSGDVWWVDSVNGSNNQEGTYDYPKASIAYLFDNTLVGAGDIVMCKPGHVETVVAAAGLDLDIAGVCVVFLGQGTNKAYVTFTTAVGADMDIDAANITLINPKFVAGIDALTGPIDVNAANFTIINGEWHDGTAIDTTDCIVGDANADGCVIDGWKYFKGDEGGTAKQSNIQFGAASEVQIKNVQISGAFDEGIIEFTAAGVDVLLENVYIHNTDTDPSPALKLHANTTGFAKNVKARVASGTTYTSSVAKIQWSNDSEGFSTDGYGGDPIGTALATGVEGLVTSVGTQTSAVAANVLSHHAYTASQTLSVGIGASQAYATGLSIQTAVASQSLSVGIGASQAYATGLSIQTAVASQSLSVGIGASQAYATGLSIQTANASQALSVGIGASQAYATGLSVVSQNTSIALIISLIASKTAAV
jgi:hypothetical protein